MVENNKEYLDIDVNSLKLIYSGKGNDGKIQFHDVFFLRSNVDIKEIKIQEEENKDGQ